MKLNNDYLDEFNDHLRMKKLMDRYKDGTNTISKQKI